MRRLNLKPGLYVLLSILAFLSVSSMNSDNGDVDQATEEKEESTSEKNIPGFEFLKEEAFSCSGQTNTVKIYRHEKTGLEFVLIPGGSFQMGSPSGEKGREDHEGPVHTVTVKPFLICRTECTQKVWDKIGGRDHRNWRGSDLPIEDVSWDECISWCKKAGFRLPTESEWEYACRAGTSTPYYFGTSESDLGNYEWYESNSSSKIHSVGSKSPNAFGLFDMHGNVCEWCQDNWLGDYSGAPTNGSSWESRSSYGSSRESRGPYLRIFRGGCYFCSPQYCRSAIRDGEDPYWSWDYHGFRPALSIPPCGRIAFGGCNTLCDVEADSECMVTNVQTNKKWAIDDTIRQNIIGMFVKDVDQILSPFLVAPGRIGYKGCPPSGGNYSYYLKHYELKDQSLLMMLFSEGQVIDVDVIKPCVKWGKVFFDVSEKEMSTAIKIATRHMCQQIEKGKDIEKEFRISSELHLKAERYRLVNLNHMNDNMNVYEVMALRRYQTNQIVELVFVNNNELKYHVIVDMDDQVVVPTYWIPIYWELGNALDIDKTSYYKGDRLFIDSPKPCEVKVFYNPYNEYDPKRRVLELIYYKHAPYGRIEELKRVQVDMDKKTIIR